MRLRDLREQVFEYAKRLVVDSFVHGAQGNISALERHEELIAITPSAADYASMTLEDIVLIDMHGTVIEGRWRPTVETSMHTLFYREREDVGAVIHCHAPYASGFAAAERPIPLVLVESAACIGREVPVAPLMRSGTDAFARLMVDTVAGGSAAIMGRHGIVTCGADLSRAYSTAVAVEDSARAYVLARTIGAEPEPIDAVMAAELHAWWRSKYKKTSHSQNS